MWGRLRELFTWKSQDESRVRKVVCGLGNPGPRYSGTRHNVGYEVVGRLAQVEGGVWQRYRKLAKICSVVVDGRHILLVKPLTFMNLSGSALQPLVRKWGVDPEDLLVIYDCLDLPLGVLRMRAGGGSGGHRGVQSIIDHLKTRDFPRIRVGIGRPPAGGDSVFFVLSSFSPEERILLEGVLDRAAAATRTWITAGIEAAMNRFNKRTPTP